MSTQSEVANSQVYNNGDQRTSKGSTNIPSRFEVGKSNAHDNLDPKDQRSIANRLASTERPAGGNQSDIIDDPLKPAHDHGNEPSKGAKIDAELQAEEQEYLQRKGKA